MAFRYGEPLTEEERTARHYALTGESIPPPRGTGRLQNPGDPNDSLLFWILVLAHAGLIAFEVYLAWKMGWI